MNRLGRRFGRRIMKKIIIILMASSFLMSCNKESIAKEVAAVTKKVSQITEETMLSPIKAESVKDLKVHFIDVGQGDATLLTCGDKSMLIDAGDNSKGTAVQLYLKKQGIKKLDYVICTHSDSDHIGGMDVIITKFDVDNVIMIKDDEKNTKTYRDLLNAIAYKNYKIISPSVGDEFAFGDALFQVISPIKDFENTNDDSISIILKHGNNSFLFAGDATLEAESYMNKGNIDLDVDVYKVSHHGSKTSTSIKFLENMSPKYAIISVGENDYGHPHSKTLKELKSNKVKVYRTDKNGTIVFTSNGKEYTIQTEISSQKKN